MRISDWSSDVCSSDLHLQSGAGTLPQIAHLQLRGIPVAAVPTQGLGIDTEPLADALAFVEINAQRDAGFGVDPGQQSREARAVARARHHAQHAYRAAGAPFIVAHFRKAGRASRRASI